VGINNSAPGAGSPGVFSPGRWLGGHVAVQLAILAAVVAGFALLAGNLAINMAHVGLRPGFAFLWRPANFAIGERLIPYTPQSTFGQAILVGILNTLLVSACGCVLATVLGVGLGIARLSGNRLLAGSVRAYVELVRNTPLLLQLFFWNATFQALPSTRQALGPLPGVLLSNRGLFFPTIHLAGGWPQATAGFVVLAAVAALLLRRQIDDNRRSVRRALVLIPVILALAAIAAVVGSHQGSIEIPEHKGFNIVGGYSLTPEFAALLVGLSINAAAGIAEIVRGGIEAIPRGQWDAARALGLPNRGTMRFVILPQVLRIVVPLMTSSYLSLIKNSSLAVAIGYPDLVNILNTEANQSGQALETILIMGGVYLLISFAVSAALNLYNARIALRRR
jgi:general L-amino acid transport system permease protein